MYDKANRLTSLTHDTAHSAEDVTAYTYDAKDQLTGVDRPGMTYDESYGYDTNGNRTNANSVTYGTPAADNRLSNDGVYTYGYDAEGNRTSKSDGTTVFDTYSYDQRNRLTVSVLIDSGGTRVVRYTYDPFDRLVKREVDTTSPYTLTDAATEYFVYDGPDIALKWVDSDGAGTASAPVLDTRYLNGPAVDQILAEEDLAVASSTDVNRVHYMFGDQQGSVRDITDNAGTLKDHIFNDSYGKPFSETHPEIKHSYGYAGYFIDKVTGLARSWGRWYDPNTGSWTGIDPSQDGANWYAYVGDSPTNFIDPTGREKRIFFPGPAGTQLPESGSIGPNHLKEGDSLVTLHDDGSTSAIGRGIPSADALLFMQDPAGYDQRKKEQAAREAALDAVQLGIGAVGLVPGAGDIADIVDAGICVYRGDWVGFGFSVGAALPVVGILIGNAKNARKAKALKQTLELGAKDAKTVDKALDTKRAVDGVNAASDAKRAAQTSPTPKALKKVEEHHLQTNKNSISTAAGGPYTPKFEALAKKRGTSLEDAMNKVCLPGHKGPHPEYNEAVYNRMEAATKGLKGKRFDSAYDRALGH